MGPFNVQEFWFKKLYGQATTTLKKSSELFRVLFTYLQVNIGIWCQIVRKRTVKPFLFVGASARRLSTFCWEHNFMGNWFVASKYRLFITLLFVRWDINLLGRVTHESTNIDSLIQ